MKLKPTYTAIFFTFILLITFNACQKSHPNNEVIDNTPYDLVLPKGFPAIQTPDNNPLTAASVALGKQLFFDPILSIDSSVACASCHFPQNAFSDTVAFSKGLEGRLVMHNCFWGQKEQAIWRSHSPTHSTSIALIHKRMTLVESVVLAPNPKNESTQIYIIVILR